MNTISDQIMEGMKTAMKAKDSVTLNTLRALKTALTNTAIAKGGLGTRLEEAEELAVVRKQIKQREDSAEQFRAAGRPELAEKEEAEITVLKQFMPAELTAEETAAILETVMKETGASTKKRYGAGHETHAGTHCRQSQRQGVGPHGVSQTVMKCCAAIIVAAGSSRRAGFDKLLAPLHGVRVLERSIRAFASCREITEIVVVCPEERFHAINGANLETEIPVTRVDGGAERHESVQNGLAALLYTPEFVAVHDGARPLITVEQISRCIQTAREYGASASAHPVTDTLKRADKERFTLPEQVERDGLWCMETPQVFQYPLLLDAYVEVSERNIQVTDEVTALQLIGHPTRLVHNHEPNPKITWPEDISRAEMLMELKHLRNYS